MRFRKLIEAGDLDAAKSTIWENPRYLVSSGDTPAILQVKYIQIFFHFILKNNFHFAI